MKRIAKFSVLLIAIVFVVLVSSQTAYCYFDSLKNNGNLSVRIGGWQNSGGDAMDYLNDINPKKDSASGDKIRYLDYVGDIIWKHTEYDENGFLKNGELNEAYKDYTSKDVKELIDIIVSYVDDFLEPTESGKIVFPDRMTVKEVEVPIDEYLGSGQCSSIPSVFLTADLEGSVYWAPVMYSVSLEGENGGDVSDYALEILYASCYAEKFGYQYLIRDYSSYNINRAKGTVEKEKNFLRTAIKDELTELTVYQNSGNGYLPITVKHQMKLPDYGTWSRFITGPNIYLGAPTYSTLGLQQQLEEVSESNREGMILMGKANGLSTELRLGLFNRGTGDDTIKEIPLILNLTRGSSENGQFAGKEKPVVKVRMVSGDVWGN